MTNGVPARSGARLRSAARWDSSASIHGPNGLWARCWLFFWSSGAFIWHYYSVRESTDDAQIDGHINPISPRVTGTVLRVLHDDNELVEAGTLLVELDPRDYEVAVDRARADLANAQAGSVAANVGVPLTQTTSSSQLVAADANVKAAEREIESARARVNEAQSNFAKVSADLKRMEHADRQGRDFPPAI